MEIGEANRIGDQQFKSPRELEAWYDTYGGQDLLISHFADAVGLMQLIQASAESMKDGLSTKCARSGTRTHWRLQS